MSRASRPAAAALLGALLALVPSPPSAGPRELPPWSFAFPRDHAAHPEFRTEWWYYTGHLRAGARRFGFQLAFFRVVLDRSAAERASAWAPHSVLFAHAALTDEHGRRFRFDERIARPALGLAGADSTRYHVWVDTWSASLAPDGRTHRLRAPAHGFGLALDLDLLKPPAVHGAGGVCRKSDEPGYASHYASLTRLRASGRILLGGEAHAVEGEAWMDHEFMDASLAPGQLGWDWFGLQLEDGRELMLYRMRRADGTIDPASGGTLVERDGETRRLPLHAAGVDRTRTWTSRASGARYPAGWIVRVPGEDLVLRLEPTLADQELVTRESGGIVYWEGSVDVVGTARGRPVRGRGYVELTGYAGPPPGPPGGR
jgi:predicted secreted hydrolase